MTANRISYWLNIYDKLKGDIYMAKLKQYYFYYGAILNAILQKNNDATPSLISNSGEIRQEYRVMTNTSKECTLLFKSVMVKKNGKRDNYDSWTFNFSYDEIHRLEEYHKKQDIPVLIYLACLKDDLKDCEIAVLNYDEFAKVVNKHNVTIGSFKGKNNYLLFYSGSRSADEAYKFPKNRIEKTFDELTGKQDAVIDVPEDLENSTDLEEDNSKQIFRQRLRKEGYMILSDENTPNYSQHDILYLETANIKATGIMTDEGFRVLAGSMINDKSYKRSLKDKNQKIRTRIMKKYIDNYKTTCDILFPSSTAAGVFIVGYSVSGPATWKNKQGKILKEINSKDI